MKVLIVGSGGREHAVADALSQSPLVTKIFTAPGNAGTSELGENVSIASDDPTALVEFADQNAIELTVVGPEVPLSMGIVDSFRTRHLPIIGPTARNARLEASKSFTKHL